MPAAHMRLVFYEGTTMNYKIIMMSALLAGSMQKAWGMDDSAKKAELEKMKEAYAHKRRVMKLFKHKTEQEEMPFDSQHWAFFAGLYQVKE